jgi:hypothetical protein
MDHRTAPRFGQHLGALAAQLFYASPYSREIVSGMGSVHVCSSHLSLYFEASVSTAVGTKINSSRQVSAPERILYHNPCTSRTMSAFSLVVRGLSCTVNPTFSGRAADWDGLLS